MFEAFGPLVGSTCVSFRGCVGWTWLGLKVDVQGYGGEGQLFLSMLLPGN